MITFPRVFGSKNHLIVPQSPRNTMFTGTTSAQCSLSGKFAFYY